MLVILMDNSIFALDNWKTLWYNLFKKLEVEGQKYGDFMGFCVGFWKIDSEKLNKKLEVEEGFEGENDGY